MCRTEKIALLFLVTLAICGCNQIVEKKHAVPNVVSLDLTMSDTNKKSLDGQNTRTVTLEVRGGQVPLDYFDGTPKFKSLTADPNSVFQAKWQKVSTSSAQEAKLIFELTISTDKKKTTIQKTLPDFEQASTVASLLNLATTDSVHVIANASRAGKKGLLQIRATDITNDDRALIDRSGQDAALDAAETAPLGIQNFRGSYQEAQIREVDVPEELIDRASGENSGIVYFQDGRIRKSADDNRLANPAASTAEYPVLDRVQNYCLVRFLTNSSNKTSLGYKLDGSITLIPASGDLLGISNSATAKSMANHNAATFSFQRSTLWQGKPEAFNKTGNGASDSVNLADLQCTIKGSSAVKVSDLLGAFGKDNVRVVFRTQNKLETYFDLKYDMGKQLRGEK